MDAEATTFEKSDFEITLPGSWDERQTDLGFDFVNRQERLQLTVSVLNAKQPLDMPKLRWAIKKLEKSRRQVIAELSNGRARFGTTRFRTSESEIEARFAGSDSLNGVIFSVAIRGCASKVITLSLVHYGIDETSVAFSCFAGPIFDRLYLKDALR